MSAPSKSRISALQRELARMARAKLSLDDSYRIRVTVEIRPNLRMRRTRVKQGAVVTESARLLVCDELIKTGNKEIVKYARLLQENETIRFEPYKTGTLEAMNGILRALSMKYRILAPEQSWIRFQDRDYRICRVEDVPVRKK